MARGLTVVEQILLAAAQLGREKPMFTAEDLIVRAWQLYPETFALQGYPQHPDSNRILTKIMGSGGLRGHGWLSKVGSKRYRLTDVGRLAAESLEGRAATAVDDSGSGNKRLSHIDRGFLPVLARMVSSSALSKFRAGGALTFSDVCAFWNISPRSTANQLNERTTQADKAIELALRYANEHPTAVLNLPGDGGSITSSDLRHLGELSEHIRSHFANELGVILGRTDERRF